MIATQVIDDFLPKNDFERLKSILFVVEFPIFWNDHVTYANEHLDHQLNRYYLTHVLYSDNKPNSDYFEEISEMFFDKLQVKALNRIKVNMYPRADLLFEHGYHRDRPYENRGALFALNTCDGYTKFKDGPKIESIENRMILFDASRLHTSTNTTNVNRRVNINFNYF